MNRPIKKIIAVMLTAVLFVSMSITAYADELRAGTVAGMPEKLVVLDDRGRSVSENGEYYFEVLDMKESELYTKNIQILNLREDASYRIYLNAQSVSSTGEIKLDEECECKIFMSDNLIYSGKVTGEGNPDIRVDGLDLGLYHPGDSRSMRVEIKWINPGHGGEIDNGARIVDSSGTTVTREASGITHIEGETVFKWIFTAAVEVTPTPGPGVSHPDSPVKTGETIMFIVMGVAVMAVALMLILVLKKRRKQSEQSTEK